MKNVFTATATAEERCFSLVMGVFVLILFAVMFPVFVLVVLGSAVLIPLLRGGNFVRWRAPEDCMSLQSWAAFEWDYQGLGGGRQAGWRALGVEVAYSGLLR